MASSEERELVVRLLADAPNPVIMDLGAYIGDEYEWFKTAFPSMRYLAVEADPRNAERFRQRYPEAALIEGAVASVTSSIEFHQCDNEIGQGIGSGSIRPPKRHLEFFPWCKFEKKITVNGYSLNELCVRIDLGYGVPGIDLLWVDLQGAERDMIAGGSWGLSKTRFMMIEAEEHEFYEGQALRPDLLAMLPDWEIVQPFGFNLFLKNRLYERAL